MGIISDVASSNAINHTSTKQYKLETAHSKRKSVAEGDQCQDEITPLVNSRTYDTFSQSVPSADIDKPISSSRTRFIHRLCGYCSDDSRRQNKKRPNKILEIDWRTWGSFVVISILIAIVACFHDNAYDSTSPSWHFDYNIYISRTDGVGVRRSNRVSLIAQIASSRPLQILSQVSSMPNRAYAKSWGLDYVRYNAGRRRVYQRSCFDKVHVLLEILNQQFETEDDSTIQRWSRPSFQAAKYDSIIILPPDSIIIELDTDIIEDMLPSEKLVAIAGWDEKRTIDSHSGIIVFNLNHKYAASVAKLWRELILPMKETCGANNDLEMLIIAIHTVIDKHEDMNDVIESLTETPNGFTADPRLIKSLGSSVPGYRAKHLEKNLADSEGILQETVDSVCYRFYPKCEVLWE